MIPVLDLAMSDRIMYSIACLDSVFRLKTLKWVRAIPGPLAAASASSPIKKSRSSVPLFAAREPPDPAPPVRYDGLFATAGLPDPVLPAPPTPPFVAIAVGKTKDGASLPANPTPIRRGAH